MNNNEPKSLFDVAQDVRKEHEEKLKKDDSAEGKEIGSDDLKKKHEESENAAD